MDGRRKGTRALGSGSFTAGNSKTSVSKWAAGPGGLSYLTLSVRGAPAKVSEEAPVGKPYEIGRSALQATTATERVWLSHEKRERRCPEYACLQRSKCLIKGRALEMVGCELIGCLSPFNIAS